LLGRAIKRGGWWGATDALRKGDDKGLTHHKGQGLLFVGRKKRTTPRQDVAPTLTEKKKKPSGFSRHKTRVNGG